MQGSPACSIRAGRGVHGQRRGTDAEVRFPWLRLVSFTFSLARADFGACDPACSKFHRRMSVEHSRRRSHCSSSFAWRTTSVASPLPVNCAGVGAGASGMKLGIQKAFARQIAWQLLLCLMCQCDERSGRDLFYLQRQVVVGRHSLVPKFPLSSTMPPPAAIRREGQSCTPGLPGYSRRSV